MPIPHDLRASLSNAAAAETSAALPPSHRREYVDWIEEAKRPPTRERRITGCVERIRAGLRYSDPLARARSLAHVKPRPVATSPLTTILR